MRTAIRLCGGIAVVAFGFYAIIIATSPATPSTSPNCGAGYCDVTAVDLLALLFVFLGTLFATLTGVLVLIAAIRRRQGALGVGLALLIFTNFAAALVYVATDAFQPVLFSAPGAYFAPGAQLPWYFDAATITFATMLALAPVPALLFSPGSHAHSSPATGEPGLRPQIQPRLALASVLIAGVALVILDRVADHYVVAGVGPEWPLLTSVAGFYVFWLVAWITLMGSLLLRRTASVS